MTDLTANGSRRALYHILELPKQEVLALAYA